MTFCMANQHRIERLGARFSFLFLYKDKSEDAGRRQQIDLDIKTEKAAGRRVKLKLVIVGIISDNLG